MAYRLETRSGPYRVVFQAISGKLRPPQRGNWAPWARGRLSTPRAAPAASQAARRTPEPRPGYFGAGPGGPNRARDRTAVPGRGCRTRPARAAAARPTRAGRPCAAPPANRPSALPSGTCPQPARGPWPRVRAVFARCGVFPAPGARWRGARHGDAAGPPQHRTARARAGAVELAPCVGSRPRQSACRSARGRPGAGALRAPGARGCPAPPARVHAARAEALRASARAAWPSCGSAGRRAAAARRRAAAPGVVLQHCARRLGH
jgi:hypothetical protein